MAQKFLNNFDSVFVASVKDSPGTGTPATELDYGILRLSDGAAAFLTNPTGGDYYVLTAFKREGTTETNREIMRVTAVDNSTTGECRVTVQRGQEGTSVKAYLSGDYVSLRLTAGAVNNWVAQFDIAKNNADTATNQANIATDKANIATNQANIATDKANIATNQANIATDKANIATNQAAAAAASYDSFDDRYLGAKASDPTLDNDGNALIEGALYWNSTAKETRTWNGTAWVTTSVANAVSRGGDTMTGPLSVPAGASGAQVPRAQEVVSKTGDTMTGNLNVPSLNGGQLAGMRNKIINGKMEIAQRGTSFSAIASGAYSLDRWVYGVTGGAVSTISQETDVPSNNEFNSSLRITVTTADTSIAAGDFQNLTQKIEGYNARDLIGRTFTLSFWVRSAKTGIHCVAFRNGGADRSYVAEYTISAANTWEFKTVTVSGGLITSGTWNWTNGAGLTVDFPSAAGSNLQTTAGAWQTGSFIATANQVNCLDAVDNIFAITGVQLEVGEVATPFEHRNVGTELALCQRYYCETRGHLTSYVSAADQDPRTPVYWPVQMRAAPTTTNAGGAVSNASSADLGSVTAMGAAFRVVAAAAGLTSVVGRVITASAEL